MLNDQPRYSKDDYINYLKLLASDDQSIWEDLEENYSLIAMHDATAVGCVMRWGDTVFRALCQLRITMWTQCTKKSIILQVKQFPDQLNLQANKNSKDCWMTC